MSSRRWQVRAAWQRRLLEEASAEYNRLRNSRRYRFAVALLDVASRPWRPLRAVSELIRAVMAERAVRFEPSTKPPYPEVDWSAPEDPVPGPEAARWGELARSYEQLLLGAGWHLATLVVKARWLEAAAALVTGVPEIVAPPLPRRSRPNDGSIRVVEPAPELRCVGPAWWTEMLGFEAVQEGTGGLDGDVLVGLAADVPGALLEAVSGARHGAAWILDDTVRDEWLPVLSRCHDVLVADPALVPVWSERLDRPIAHLPPAVQPKLDNPIGWWSGQGHLAVTPRHGAARPAAWSALAALARAQVLPAERARLVDRVLGVPLPSVSAPAWASPDLADDWSRLVRLRAVMQRHGMAERVRAVADRLSGESVSSSGDEPVTVMFSSMRPDRQMALMEQLARQSHRELEVVGVLHGDLPQGHLQRLKRRSEELRLRARFLTRPSSQSLGECLQAGVDASEGDVVFRIDDDDLYGVHYVEDMLLALRFSEAGIVYKHTVVLLDEPTGRLYVVNPGRELCYVGTNPGGGRLAVRRELLEHVSWRAVRGHEDTLFGYDCMLQGAPLLVSDRFNHVFVRGRRDHTWSVSFRNMLRAKPHRQLPKAARPADFDI